MRLVVKGPGNKTKKRSGGHTSQIVWRRPRSRLVFPGKGRANGSAVFYASLVCDISYNLECPCVRDMTGSALSLSLVHYRAD
jgi:hypothetical protein